MARIKWYTSASCSCWY